MPIEYRNLRAAFLAIFAEIAACHGDRYDHAEAERMFQRFLDDLAANFSDAWHRQLVS